MANYNLIYDKYLSSDFTGKPDLNPQREIIKGLEDEKDIEILSIEDEVLNKIKEKIKEVKEINLSSNRPPLDKEESFIEQEVETTHEKKVNILDNTDISFNNGSLSELEDKFKETLAIIIASEDKDALKELKKGHNNFSLCEIKALEKMLDDDDEFNRILNNGNPDEIDKIKKDKKKRSLSTGEREKIKQLITDKKKKRGGIIKGNKKDKYKLCLYQDIGLLQFLLIIFAVLKYLNKLITYVLSIAVPVSEYAALLCSCWISPANIGEIIQKIAQTVVSNVLKIILFIIDSLLKQLFKKCPQPMAADLLKRLEEILGIMDTGVGHAIDVISLSSNLPKRLLDKKKELLDKYKKAIEAEITNIKNGNLLKDLGMDENAVNLINTFLQGMLENNSGMIDLDSIDPSIVPETVVNAIKGKMKSIEEAVLKIEEEIISIKNTKQIDKEDDLALEILQDVIRKG